VFFSFYRGERERREKVKKKWGGGGRGENKGLFSLSKKIPPTK
jgi:hypothetical protein